QTESLWQELRELATRYSRGIPDLSQKIMELEPSPSDKATRWLRELRSAIRFRHALMLTYKPFHMSESYMKTVSPYYLRRYNQRWILVAWDHDLKAFQHFGLDRIHHVQQSLQSYHLRPFDAQEYFRHVVGVSIPEGGRKIEIGFKTTPLQGEYIESKPFHSSVRVLKRDKKSWLFTMTAIPNYELEQKFLSFGEHVIITGPKSFRRKIARRIALMHGNY